MPVTISNGSLVLPVVPTVVGALTAIPATTEFTPGEIPLNARTLSQLRTDFKELLNRDDCTEAQANQFIVDGINRCSRVLGQYIPAFEKEVVLTADANGRMDIPSDFLSMIDFEDDIESEFVAGTRDEMKAQRLRPGGGTVINNFSAVERSDVTGFQPRRLWVRRIKQFEFFPRFTEGDTVTLLYKADPGRLCDDNDTIPIMTIAPEAVKYCALIFAYDYFRDLERLQVASAAFTNFVEEIKEQHDCLIQDEINVRVHSRHPTELY